MSTAGRDSPSSARSAQPTRLHLHAADRLHQAVAKFGSPACVGLDPVLDRLPQAVRALHHDPVSAIEHFCTGILDAVSRSVTIVKPQSACFERYGPQGMALLRRIMVAAHQRGLLVILDAKRGDIGVSAEHYAAAAFGAASPASSVQAEHASDFLTVNAYLGIDTVEPYLAGACEATNPAAKHTAASHGVFVLVRTSNPGSDAVQSQQLADGRTVAEMMADHVAELGKRASLRGPQSGLSCVGAVVGATKSSDGEAMRRRMPDTPFLIPGYGAQGGTLEDLRPMLRTRGNAADSGVIVNASRSVIFPDSTGANWHADIADAADRFADELRTLFSRARPVHPLQPGETPRSSATE